jgi:transcriptional regulator GlxA family with amidase domain
MNGALNVNGAVTATNFSGSGTGLTGIGAHAGTGAGPRWKAPRQSSSGGKERLGRVSKMGNRYLRKLLVVGAHAAPEAGISLRYLQKLFTARNSTCSDFIYSVRLDHAARLLSRRASLGTSQPLSEIAYACGFRDYTHFARKFRRRFGPGKTKTGAHSVGPETVRAGTGESAP